MEYFIYCRDHPGTEALRAELNEAHWSFMDQYAEAMIARGPTLAPDGETATGSVHIVDLPDADAARRFAFDEPNYRAGVYRDVFLRRWSNTLGATMWDFTGAVPPRSRFLILAPGRPGMSATRAALGNEQNAHLAMYRDRIIVCGSLLSDDGAEWQGTAMMVELGDRTAAEAVLTDGPYARIGLFAHIEVHPWRFGGRPQP